MSVAYRIFLKGLLAVLPITITIYLLVWIATKAESAFGDPMRTMLSPTLYFPGLGVLILLILVFLAGLLVNNYITSQFFTWLENQVRQVPLIKAVYNPLKDVMNLFANQERKSRRAVLIDAPQLGGAVIGLVTRDRFEDFPPSSIPNEHLAVFVPFSYALGGFTVLVHKSKIRELNISTERAMQLAITGWIDKS